MSEIPEITQDARLRYAPFLGVAVLLGEAKALSESVAEHLKQYISQILRPTIWDGRTGNLQQLNFKRVGTRLGECHMCGKEGAYYKVLMVTDGVRSLIHDGFCMCSEECGQTVVNGMAKRQFEDYQMELYKEVRKEIIALGHQPHWDDATHKFWWKPALPPDLEKRFTDAVLATGGEWANLQ